MIVIPSHAKSSLRNCEQAAAISTGYVLPSYFPMTKIIMAGSPPQMNWREERRLAMDRA
jgi:hypothetical protein